MKNLLIILMFVLPVALFSASPRCGAGIEVSIVDASGKVIKKGKLNSQAKLTLDGVSDANWDIKLTNNKKSIVLGINKNKKRVDKTSPLLYQAKFSDYQDGEDIILRKRPGRQQSKDGGSSGLATGKRGAAADANHNTTRSNRTANAIDDDSDDDNIDDDCDDAQITVTDKGNGRVEITVTILK